MDERWVVVWRGEDPAVPGRKLEAEGIEMRLAATSWGAHGGGLGISFLGLFRRKASSKLLVRDTDRDRAKAILRS